MTKLRRTWSGSRIGRTRAQDPGELALDDARGNQFLQNHLPIAPDLDGQAPEVAPLAPDDVFRALGRTVYEEPDDDTVPGRTERPEGRAPRSLLDKLDQSTTPQKRAPHDRRETMRERVGKSMASYDNRVGDERSTVEHDAVLLAMGIEGTARVIADELYDPALKPELAKRTSELYDNELRAGLPIDQARGREYADEVLQLARAIVSDDPVALYMHLELPLDEAARRVRIIAEEGGKEPDAMLAILREKWEAELAGYTLEEIQFQQDGRGAYSLAESTGEMSAPWLESVVADPAAMDGQGAMQLGDAALARLQALEDAVAAPAEQELPNAQGEPDGPQLTDRQRAHLAEVEAEDQRVLADRREQVRAALTGGFLGRQFSPAEADVIIERLRAGLPQLPLTITVEGEQWFGEDRPVEQFDSMFRAGSSRRREARMVDVLGKPNREDDAQLDYLGRWEGARDRGEHYLKFRTWKDQRMTGHRGFTDDELPTFGALNVNWEANHGTSGPTNDMTRRYEARTGERWPAEGVQGVNYYGDVHFRLNPEAVRNRVVYTATDHGRPHRDPFLMLADFITDDTDDYQACVTGLKPTLKHSSRALQMINAVLGNANVAHDLPFEIQIFGEVDVARDVEAIYVASSVSPLVAQRLMALQDRLPVGVHVIDNPGQPVEYDNHTGLVQKAFSGLEEAVREAEQQQQQQQQGGDVD